MSRSENKMFIEMKVIFTYARVKNYIIIKKKKKKGIVTFMIEQTLHCVPLACSLDDHPSAQGHLLIIDFIIENMLPWMNNYFAFLIILFV